MNGGTADKLFCRSANVTLSVGTVCCGLASSWGRGALGAEARLGCTTGGLTNLSLWSPMFVVDIDLPNFCITLSSSDPGGLLARSCCCCCRSSIFWCWLCKALTIMLCCSGLNDFRLAAACCNLTNFVCSCNRNARSRLCGSDRADQLMVARAGWELIDGGISNDACGWALLFGSDGVVGLGERPLVVTFV